MGSGDGRVGATTKILDNGSPSLRWNLVFLGDGYREPELAKYSADVQKLVAAIVGRAPFDTLAPAINAFRIDVVSTQSGADDPTGDNGANVGSGWQNFRPVFATSDGVIYAVRSDGVLLWYRHEGWTDGAIAWAEGEGAIVGHSWQSFQQVVATSDGVIYGVQPDGTLRWYQREGWADGASRWHPESSKIVGAQVWQNFPARGSDERRRPIRRPERRFAAVAPARRLGRRRRPLGAAERNQNRAGLVGVLQSHGVQ